MAVDLWQCFDSFFNFSNVQSMQLLETRLGDKKCLVGDSLTTGDLALYIDDFMNQTMCKIYISKLLFEFEPNLIDRIMETKGSG